jgi:hypothetical protein
MKTIIITLITLATLIGTKTEETFSNKMESNFSSSNVESSNSMIVKATNYEGEVIPLVQLLCLDVFAYADQGQRVKTTLVNGERIPVVTLPELDIVASK